MGDLGDRAMPEPEFRREWDRATADERADYMALVGQRIAQRMEVRAKAASAIVTSGMSVRKEPPSRTSARATTAATAAVRP